MPKLFDIVALDQIVEVPGIAYSEPTLSNVLSRADKLVISAVVSDVSGTTPTLTVGVEGSPDHVNWQAIDGATPLMSAEALSKTGANLVTRVFTSDQGVFTRIKVTLGGTSTKARIKVHVTGRVGGG